MMSGTMLKAWKNVKHHVPLIKFKKGGPLRENTPSAGSTGSVGASRAAGSGLSKGKELPVIEDWQLPPHYRRAPFDEKEIDAINSGGAY